MEHWHTMGQSNEDLPTYAYADHAWGHTLADLDFDFYDYLESHPSDVAAQQAYENAARSMARASGAGTVGVMFGGKSYTYAVWSCDAFSAKDCATTHKVA